MGQSTDANICYGIPFEEGTEFPWDNEPFDGDFEEWYLREVSKFKPSFEIYDENGEYLNGIRPSQEIIDKYFDEQREIVKNNKCPVEVFTHCHHECPMYIIGIRGTEQTANRGYPLELQEITKQDPTIITDFCKKYNIKYTEEPKWLLYSYWN